MAVKYPEKYSDFQPVCQINPKDYSDTKNRCVKIVNYGLF